jgi:hypothetical protein
MNGHHRQTLCAALTVGLGILLSQCGGSSADSNDQPADILDYREARIFDDISTTNRLLIDVTSRMTLTQGSSTKQYLLLSNHPREITFTPSMPVYPGVIEDARGASDITFIYSLDDTTTIVARRYSAADTANPGDMHECRNSDFSKLSRPKQLMQSEVDHIATFDQVLATASSTATVVGTFEYDMNGKHVKLDFPVSLINIDPRSRAAPTNPDYQNWQAVSPLLPLYVGTSGTDCENVHPGYLALRNQPGAQSAVFLCLSTVDGQLMDDYVCTTEIPGAVKLYAVR